MKQWKYYEPSFPHTKYNIDSGWGGHKYFVYDLVRNIKPKHIVELGTYKGDSFFTFCQASKDTTDTNTIITAIDTWKGDKHTTFYGPTIYQTFKRILKKL